MANESKDQPVLDHIDGLVKEEGRLYAPSELTNEDRGRLAKIKVELDQCWDLLRQRRALREFGRLYAYLTDLNPIPAYDSGMPCWSAMQCLKSGRLKPSRAGVPSGAARRYCTGHEMGTPNSFATWSGQ